MPEENGMIVANDQEILRNGKKYRTYISDNCIKELYYGDAIIFERNPERFVSKEKNQIYVSLKDDYEVVLNNKSYGGLYNDGWALYKEENKGTNYISPNGEFLFPYEDGIEGAILNIEDTAITELKSSEN